MITRYAFFEGSVKAAQKEAFRAAVMETLVPRWTAFPGALAIRVSFAVARDEGAPDFPMILAVDYPDRVAVDAALASPARTAAKAATDAVLSRFFEGRIHHHVTEAYEFNPRDHAA